MEEADRATDEDVVELLKEQREKSGLAYEEFAPIVWESLMSLVVWTEAQDKVEAQALKEVKVRFPITLRMSTGLRN